MEPIELGITIHPADFFEAMVDKYTPQEIADIVMQLPRLVKDKQFVKDVHDMYGKILKIYEEAGK